MGFQFQNQAATDYGDNYSFSLFTVSTALQALTTITEMLQGPCYTNQLQISDSNFFEIAVEILKINEESVIQMKKQNQMTYLQALGEKLGEFGEKFKRKKSSQNNPHNEQSQQQMIQSYTMKRQESLSQFQRQFTNGTNNLASDDTERKIKQYNQILQIIKQEQLQKDIDSQFIIISKFCSDFFEELENVYNLTFVKEFEWIVQELKTRVIQTMESCLEANQNKIIFQKMVAKVPQELLMLNLIWTYDTLQLEEKIKKNVEITMNHFKQEFQIDYSDFKSYGQINAQNYKVANIERGFKQHFLVLYYQQNNKNIFSGKKQIVENQQDNDDNNTNVLVKVLKKINKLFFDKFLITQENNENRINSQEAVDDYVTRDYAKDYEKAQEFFAGHTENIEILLEGEKLFKIYFPRLPIYDIILRDNEIKHQFLKNVDRVSHSTKINAIIDHYEEFRNNLQSEYEFLMKTKKIPFIYYIAINGQIQQSISFMLACVQSILVLFWLSGVHELRESTMHFNDSTLTKVITIFSIVQVVFALILFIVLIFKQQFFGLKKAKKILNEVDTSQWYRIKKFLWKAKIYSKYLILKDINSIFFMAYAFIAVVSFYFPVLSVLLMLSIFKKLNLAQDILLAVLKPWRSLLVVLLIFVIVSYYFALMAYYNYNEKYSPNCETFSGCFYFVIDNTFKIDGGFPSMYEGSITKIPEAVSDWFDLIFSYCYVLVILILTIQVIQGLIIDTFQQIRNEKESLQNDMNTSCFICGIDRIDLDKKSKVMDRGFDYHVKNEHNLWNYMFYLGYITHKNSTDCSGFESYVLNCVESGSVKKIKWLPIQRAILLEGDQIDDSDQYDNLQ